jgi:hypothetical protein
MLIKAINGENMDQYAPVMVKKNAEIHNIIKKLEESDM